MNLSVVNNIFEQEKWLNIVAHNQWKEIKSIDSDGNVVGRLAVVEINGIITMPPHTQTLGIWITPDAYENYGLQKRILVDLLKQIDAIKKVELRLAPENKYVLPLIWQGYRVEPRFTYRINDLSDLNRVYQRFNNTAKKNIKSAKNKVTISYKTDPEVFWMLLNKTFEIQNMRNPLSKEVIVNIITQSTQLGFGKSIMAIDDKGNVHSGAFFVYDENVCYYLFGGSDYRYRSSGAQSLVIWEGIQLAAKYSRIFDFEGSMIEGIENFFRQFGTECVPYFVCRKQNKIHDLIDCLKILLK